MAFLTRNKAKLSKKLSITLVLRKTPFFRRKLPKIAENCDHNIDPWSPWSRPLGRPVLILCFGVCSCCFARRPQRSWRRNRFTFLRPPFWQQKGQGLFTRRTIFMSHRVVRRCPTKLESILAAWDAVLITADVKNQFHKYPSRTKASGIFFQILGKVFFPKTLAPNLPE
jgi:hypothetical protein